jgi:hypothetical protein
MTQKEHIQKEMGYYAMNIDDFEIDEIVKRSDGSECRITQKTENSIEVYMKAKTKKGINYRQWFDMRKFNKTFNKI